MIVLLEAFFIEIQIIGDTRKLGGNAGYVLVMLDSGFSWKSKYLYPAGSWMFRFGAQKRSLEWRMALRTILQMLSLKSWARARF